MTLRLPSTAMVLAAGLGKRMREVSADIPKPLVAVAGRTLIDRALDMLERSGISQAVVNTSYMAEKIEQHLQGRHQPHIRISHEAEPLETGGGIAHALRLLGDGLFFSLNSDVICVDGPIPALHRLAQHWKDKDHDAVLLLHPREQAYGYEGQGDFIMEAGRIRRRKEGETAPYVFSGIQLLHSRFFHRCPAGAFSLNVLYNRTMDKDGWMTRIGAIIHDGLWLHVGDRLGLNRAEQILSAPSESGNARLSQ